MKKILATAIAVLSINAMAASIPAETHTLNGVSIFNENGVMWDRGEAQYDAQEKGVWLAQYIKEANGSWTKNMWLSPCAEKKSVLVRQVKDLWTRSPRMYDVLAQRVFNGDTNGVTAFKAALCPVGSMIKVPRASAGIGSIQVTLKPDGSPHNDPSEPIEFVGKIDLRPERQMGGIAYFFVTDSRAYSLAFSRWTDPDTQLSFKLMQQSGKDAKLSGYMRKESDGSERLDKTKPITITLDGK